MKHLKHTLMTLLALLLFISTMPAYMFAEDAEGQAAGETAEAITAEAAEDGGTENAGETGSGDAEETEEPVQNLQDGETPHAAEGTEIQQPEGSGMQETEYLKFTPARSDYLSYDPLYIAKYVNPDYVNMGSVSMDRYVNVVSAAKGVATYNIEKQKKFEADGDNYIAAVNYEMPVYDLDDESQYYIAIPNVNKFNSNFRAYGLTVAYNNDNGEVISGWKYEKGILYIPKTAIEDPKNKKNIPEAAEIAVQLNYAIGGDMDFSKTIPVQILSGEKPENMTVHADNIFDVDGLSVRTGEKGRKKDDISVFLNGHMIPVNPDAWEYDSGSGILSIRAMPGIVSNINVVFETRTVLDKVGDACTGFINRLAGEAYAASATPASMTPLRNSAGQEVKLKFDTASMFIGWRGHYSTKVMHKVSRSAFSGCNEWENSVRYMYGGYTNMSGADMSSSSKKEKDAGLAPLWAIMSYAYGGDTGLATSTNNIQHDTQVTHYVTPTSTETHTMYEWLLIYRNSLEKSKEVWADSKGNGLAGANNFAAHWPVNITVQGSSTGLVTDENGSAKNNPDFVFATNELSNSDWYAASCSELDDAAASDANGDVYVTCLDMTNDYIVLAFARASSGNSQTMTAIYKFGINAGYVRIRKQPAGSQTDYLSECPNNYGLSGAVYELYTDPSCTEAARARDLGGRKISLTTGNNGLTDIAVVEPGRYYAKEVTASRGYELEKPADNAGYPGTDVTILNTADNPAVIVSNEKPSYGIPGLNICKIDPSGRYAWKKLMNAEYTISYYDVLGKGDITGREPDRSWTFRTRKMTGSSAKGSVYAGIDFAADEPLEGNGEFYTENGRRVIPCGWITIKEKAAPSGLALNEEVHYGRIFQPVNGAAAVIEVEGADKNGDLTVEPVVEDEPQAVTIIIDKKNAHTGKNIAQESESGHSSTRHGRFSSLAGAEYEVYYDDDDLGSPELVGVIKTDENGHGELSVRELGDERMLGDKLALGSYIIKETKAPQGFVRDKYILSGNEQKMRPAGSIDISCSYKAAEKNVSKVTAGNFSGEAHRFRTRAESTDTNVFRYTVSSADEPVRTYISKTDVTTGKELPGARLQIISMNKEDRGTVVEEWISGDKEHLVWELPSGRYILREITAPYGYDTAEDAEFEIKEDVIINRVHMENKPVRIATNAESVPGGSHHGTAMDNEVIRDNVKISSLYKGRTYKVTGKLVDKATGETLTGPDGKETYAEKEFTADSEDEEVDLEFILDSSTFTGENYAVAFEKLYRVSKTGEESPEGGQDTRITEIAKHEDLNDASQTVCYGGIAATRALDSKEKSKNITSKKTSVIKDLVDYRGLSVKEEYTLDAELFDKTDGKMTGIKASASFTPVSSDGTAEVEFRFDSRGLEGHSLVVFETLRLNGRFISEHRNPEDAAQTVHIKARTTPDTGSGNILLAWITLTTAAGMFLLIMILRTYSERRRTDI